MGENGTSTPSRSTRLLFGALLAALLLLRSPESLLHPQFWAEDGTVFFQEAFNHGFLKTILQPASGYLHTFPRLVAGLALLLPMAQAPLVFNLAAFAVQLVPAFYLLSARMSRFLPAYAARAVAALVYVALPASFETHANLTNSHWHLALAAVCILAAAPAAGAGARALDALLLTLFALTGPFSVLFLPLVAPRLLALARGIRTDRGPTHPVIVAAGAALQLGFVAFSARLGSPVAQPDPLSLREAMTVVSMHTFFDPVFGINGFRLFYQALPPVAYALGLGAVAFLLFVAARDRVQPLLILFYLAATSIALSFLFPLNDLRLWLLPQAGPRYFLFACVFVQFAILHLALASRSFRPVGYALLAATALTGIPADFFHAPQPDVRWADHVAVFQSLPAGSDFYVPVVPLYHEGLVLHKKSSPRAPSPLSGLRPVAATTPADFSVRRPEKIGLTKVDNDRYLSVSGWAIDGAARESAGGVYVIVDDALFPAVYGLPADVDVDGRLYTACGFSRWIPVREIGAGAHEISIAVLTRDGRGWYRPAAARALDTREFFP